MRTLLLALALILLTGCTSRWAHPDYTPERWGKDASACAARAGQAVGGATIDPLYNMARMSHFREIEELCLVGKGWQQQG